MNERTEIVRTDVYRESVDMYLSNFVHIHLTINMERLFISFSGIEGIVEVDKDRAANYLNILFKARKDE